MIGSGELSMFRSRKPHGDKPKEIDEWVSQQQGKHICRCGCGRSINVVRAHYWYGPPAYLRGHYPRRKSGGIGKIVS